LSSLFQMQQKIPHCDTLADPPLAHSQDPTSPELGRTLVVGLQWYIPPN
jgi:hypothetical protein